MPTVCKNCGEPITEIRKFCENCGAKIETENVPPPKEESAEQIQPQQQSAPPIQLRLDPADDSSPPKEPEPAQKQYTVTPAAPVYGGVNIPSAPSADAPPSKGSKYAPVGTFAYMGLMILMNIPVIGLIASIILARGKGSVSRRNFARATLIFKIIGITFAIAATVFIWSIWAQINEFLIQQGIEVSFWF
jgi:hypothetical protein